MFFYKTSSKYLDSRSPYCILRLNFFRVNSGIYRIYLSQDILVPLFSLGGTSKNYSTAATSASDVFESDHFFSAVVFKLKNHVSRIKFHPHRSWI